MQQASRDKNGQEQVRTIAEGTHLIGGVLLGLAVGFYLPLKERGVLETPEARARMKKKKALRSFPTKGWF